MTQRVNFSSKQIETMLEEVKQDDMYHSLTIEGYKISDELIENVTTGNQNAGNNDKKTKDALAAKGYADTFNQIKKDLKIEVEKNIYAGNIVRKLYSRWFVMLFGPSVQ